MSDSFDETFFKSDPPLCETRCGRRRYLDESDRQTKRLKSDDHKSNVNEDQPITQLSDEESEREAKNCLSNNEKDPSFIEQQTTTVELSDVSSSDENEPNEVFITEQLSKKLVPSLDALILKGCFKNFESKSILIKEYSKYCVKAYSSVEMLIKNLSPFDLLAEHKLMDCCRRNCSKLKCLRLSYCVLSVDLLKSLKSWFHSLQCLHMEHTYGIETREEWETVGQIYSESLINLSFNADSQDINLTGMLTELQAIKHLTLEGYTNNMSELLSSVNPHLYKLSLLNYFDVNNLVIKALAKRCGPYLKRLEVTYNSFHKRRANCRSLFTAICENLVDLREFQFKFISSSNMRPVFKLINLQTLDLQLSNANFIHFPAIYHLESLHSLFLTNILLNPTRVSSIASAFPCLKVLSISGLPNRQYKDTPVFCCECKNRERNDDNCSLCYQNCVIAFIEFSMLKTLKLNYVRIKSSISTALPYIPCLKRLVINPFQCQCSRSLVMAAIKIAELRRFKLIIRKLFVREALEEEHHLPESLEIIEYTEYSDN